MNRIRKYGNEYQVIITPHQKFDSGVEFLIGNWADNNFKNNYKIISFKTFSDAFNISKTMPDLNWDQIILWHKDIFADLFHTLKLILKTNNLYETTISPNLIHPMELKQIMFNRIILAKRSSIPYHTNDIITFRISNDKIQDLNKLEYILENTQKLNIVHKINQRGVIKFIGKTNIGTTYEIILMTTMIKNWSVKNEKRNDISLYHKLMELNKILMFQKGMNDNV